MRRTRARTLIKVNVWKSFQNDMSNFKNNFGCDFSMCTVQLFGARTFKMVLFLKPNVGNTQPRSECNVMWIRKYLLLSVTKCALLWVSVLISEVNWKVQGSLVQCQVFTDISVLISDWTGTTVSIWTYQCDSYIYIYIYICKYTHINPFVHGKVKIFDNFLSQNGCWRKSE